MLFIGRKKLYLVLLFSFAATFLYGNEKEGEINKSEYWRPLLEQSFMRTFSSSQEFANSKTFQCLGYDLAEISQIKRVTPFPKTISIDFRKIEESERLIASETRRVLTFDKLEVSCEKVQYFGMTMEGIVFSFPNCVIEKSYLERGKIRFAEVSEIALKVKVSEDNLLSVMKLYAKSSALSSVRILINPGKVKCLGRVKLGFAVADFNLKGYIKMLSSKRVDLVCEKLYLNGISQPRAFIKPIMNYVNPVFDSSKVWINLNIKSMNLEKGFVETFATIERKGNK